MARTLKSTLNLLVRNPIMNNRPSANYGICAKEPYRIPSSVFMLFPFFCNCLHSIFSSACYYTINLRRCVRAGILSGFPGSSFRRLSSARLLRGSGLHGSPDPLQPGGGCNEPPTDVKDQNCFTSSGETPHIIPHSRPRCKRKKRGALTSAPLQLQPDGGLLPHPPLSFQFAFSSAVYQ